MSDKPHRTPAMRRATGAFCRQLLEDILPPIREASREVGYAIAVHGSLERDIDLVAIPWREHNVAEPDELVRVVCGAVSGVLGRCMRQSTSTAKPHGRVAYTLIHGGFIAEIDLSVMPTLSKSAPSEAS